MHPEAGRGSYSHVKGNSSGNRPHMFSEARTLSFMEQMAHLLCYSGRNNNYSGLQSPALLSLYLKKEQKKTKANNASTKPSELAFSCWTKAWQQELLRIVPSRSCFVTAARHCRRSTSGAKPCSGAGAALTSGLLPRHRAPGVLQVCSRCARLAWHVLPAGLVHPRARSREPAWALGRLRVPKGVEQEQRSRSTPRAPSMAPGRALRSTFPAHITLCLIRHSALLRARFTERLFSLGSNNRWTAGKGRN